MLSLNYCKEILQRAGHYLSNIPEEKKKKIKNLDFNLLGFVGKYKYVLNLVVFFSNQCSLFFQLIFTFCFNNNLSIFFCLFQWKKKKLSLITRLISCLNTPTCKNRQFKSWNMECLLLFNIEDHPQNKWGISWRIGTLPPHFRSRHLLNHSTSL